MLAVVRETSVLLYRVVNGAPEFWREVAGGAAEIADAIGAAAYVTLLARAAGGWGEVLAAGLGVSAHGADGRLTPLARAIRVHESQRLAATASCPLRLRLDSPKPVDVPGVVRGVLRENRTNRRFRKSQQARGSHRSRA